MKFKFETLLTERHVVVKDDFNRTHGWNTEKSTIACQVKLPVLILDGTWKSYDKAGLF